MKKSTRIHILTRPVPNLILWMIGINLLILNLWVIANYINGWPAVLGTSTTTSGRCPQACVDKINAISGSKAAAKEFFVPLGSGTGRESEWTDVAGVKAEIDTGQYGKIKQTVFEATVNVPTGNQTIWVRLYNTTAAHPVWYSEMTMEGMGPTLLTSSPLVLDSGKHTYQLQLKTQLKFPATISQARVRITTN